MSSVPTLGYWDIRGRAQPIRLLLKYKGVKFNDKSYQFGPGNSFADMATIQQLWLADKQSLGLDFPNLPYYIDGDLKLTQSMTILRYLGRKYGLIGTDDRTLARQEMAEQQILDIMGSLFPVILAHNYKEKREEYIADSLIPQLESFAKFLGSNEWITPALSYVDFLVYETLDWLRLFSPQTFDKFPTLVHYLKRFENLKPIKEYMSCPEFRSWPLCGPYCQNWGYIKQ